MKEEKLRAVAYFRIALGALTWIAPRKVNRLFGVSRATETPELVYMNRVFGVRAVALGIGWLASSGDARRLWHRLWLLCDGADTVMGTAMAARGALGPFTAARALAVTGGCMAADLAAMKDEAGAP